MELSFSNQNSETPPVNVQRIAYQRYFPTIEAFPYPRAFKIPICFYSSSTIRVIVVRLINAATREEMEVGTLLPIAAYGLHYLPYPLYSVRLFLSCTYHFGFSRSSIFCCAFAPKLFSCFCNLPFSIFNLLLSLACSYFLRPSSSSFCS